MTTPSSHTALARLQTTFVAVVLPRILSHGRVYFRGIRCPHRREDAIQEMIALAWKWHLRLARRGKDATRFLSVLASRAARGVHSGHRLAGPENSHDVLFPPARQRHPFAVGRLPDFEALTDHPAGEALADNTQPPPDEAVCSQLDFAAWLASLAERNRGIALDLMVGERTRAVAHKYGLSAGRISQLRREFCQGWRAFRGELPTPTRSPAVGVA